VTWFVEVLCLLWFNVLPANAAQASPAQTPAKQVVNIDRLLEDLRSKDDRVRTAAATALKEIDSTELKLTTAQGLAVLKLAAEPSRFSTPDPAEVAADLIGLLTDDPRPEYVPVVERLFGQLSSAARPAALSLVSQVESEAAAKAYMRIMHGHAKAGRIADASADPIADKPRFAEIFFPELLTYAKDPNLSFDLYHVCLAYCEANLLKPEVLAPFTDQVLISYRTHARELTAPQQAQGTAWMWEETYLAHRNEAALLLDLLGYFSAGKVEEELRRALRLRDPRIQYFAISSLLRLGKAVPAGYFEDVAAAAEMRNWLYDRLREGGKESLFPKKYRTQAAFAESNLVDWLTDPDELGQAPDEIELMKVIPMDLGPTDGVGDYYVFRFRVAEPHPRAKDGWLAGVAGPFAKKDIPSTRALGHTFSAFEKWSSKSPDAHLRQIRSEIEEYWKDEAKKPKGK
jgi:hypothetical protein